MANADNSFRKIEDRLRVEYRRAKVAALIIRGIVNQFEICERLGMDRSQHTTIHRDIQKIKEQWKQSTLRDFDEAKGKELAHIDACLAELWKAWEQSWKHRVSLRNKENKRKRKRGSGMTTAYAEVEKKTEKRDPNDRFMRLILDCIDKRCELLGLTVKNISEGGMSAPPIVAFVVKRSEPQQQQMASPPVEANGSVRSDNNGQEPQPDSGD